MKIKGIFSLLAVVVGFASFDRRGVRAGKNQDGRIQSPAADLQKQEADANTQVAALQRKTRN